LRGWTPSSKGSRFDRRRQSRNLLRCAESRTNRELAAAFGNGAIDDSKKSGCRQEQTDKGETSGRGGIEAAIGGGLIDDLTDCGNAFDRLIGINMAYRVAQGRDDSRRGAGLWLHEQTNQLVGIRSIKLLLTSKRAIVELPLTIIKHPSHNFGQKNACEMFGSM